MSETPENVPASEVDTVESQELAAVEKYARSNPQTLPPQFGGDPEKFIKSWKDMRAEITKLQQKVKTPEINPATTSESKTQEAPPAQVDKLAVPDKPAAPTVDVWSQVGAEIAATGSVSPETKAALNQKFGIPQEIVDNYVTGIQYRQRQAAEEAAKVVGGQESLKMVLDWARDSLSDAEREATNQALQGPGWQNVLLGLKTRMASSSPTKDEPTQVNGASRPSPGVVPFANRREMTSAIRDPRYGVDPTYTALVQDRIRITGNTKHDQ